jgi:hypothetical protein
LKFDPIRGNSRRFPLNLDEPAVAVNLRTGKEVIGSELIMVE